ncbi:MAG: sulfatase [Planctomycetaceae bacterium]|nr:sulfatase [Planctomycetales bacterium]MCB9922597.1 sulfatase [Planctomycetaceae bacterium]
MSPYPCIYASESTPKSVPNIVLILADDLGYGDLACYGSGDLKTPNIDQLAREGLRLTSCYAAAANCSPARTGLMTGRTPTRVGVHNWIPMFSPVHVRREEITIATLLRNAGYDTAHFGKWHLNGDFNLPSQPQPPDHGFNYWFSTQNNALPNHRNPNNFVRNGSPAGPLDGYSGPLVTDEAVRWLKDVRDKSKPFFMYVCYHEPHEPIASDKKYADLYPSEDPSYSAHHGNITQMDGACGRLLRTLDELGVRENTFVMFTSDNGPAITGIHPHGSPGPFREKKGHLYEGGIRVPGIVRWPGHVEQGQVSDEAISGVDLLPTLCELADIQPPSDRALDGTSFLPALRNETIRRRRPLYWHFVRASSAPKVAMRVDDWKVLAKFDAPPLKPSADIVAEEMHALKTAKLVGFELYNLKDDPAETKNLVDQEPQKLAQLVAQLREYYAEVQSESPVWPVWNWPRYESQRIEWPAYRK